jgi:hypothetical protein
MFGLAKIIPLLILLGGSKEAIERFKPLLSYTETVAVQTEVNEITKMLVLDHISAPDTFPTPESFPEYLRQNMRVKKEIERDVSNDFWGTPYRLERSGNDIRVRSAGPDKAYETADDIYTTRELA